MILFYRLPGGEQFSQVTTTRSPKGWYNGTVPGDAATGKSLQYYFEARDAGDKEVASNGRNDSPNLMLIREGAPVVGRGNEIIWEHDYADLAAFERENAAFYGDTEAMKHWRALWQLAVQGSTHDELLQEAPSIA